MRVSTRGDYAARALLSLALHSETSPTSVREIAERTVLPQPYLEQILLALKGAGLVRSKRGVGGGYVLARDPEDIKLSEIIRAVDGPITAGD
ncbi:MAG: Rrf2 family transcriptional regulator, partial [Acidimicrobiaceae bacterium]